MIHQPCHGLFACTAILCFNYENLSFFFYNFTDCSPKPIAISSETYLLPVNRNLSLITSKSFSHGFVCSDCRRTDLIRSSMIILDRCKKSPTQVRLNAFCPDTLRPRNEENNCRCFPSNNSIERLHQWYQFPIEMGKGNLNPKKAQTINRSASSLYFFFGVILFTILFGGMVGVLSHFLQSKRRKK